MRNLDFYYKQLNILNYEICLGDQKLTLENYNQKYNHRHLNNIAINYVSYM